MCLLSSSKMSTTSLTSGKITATSGSSSTDTIKSYISNLEASNEAEIIKRTLKNIREKIHASKQFYKEFLATFFKLDGVVKLLEIVREKLEDESVIDLSVSVLATICLDKNNAEQVSDGDGISVLASVLRQYSSSSISITNRCARALANLAKSIDIKEKLDEDVIPILVHALDQTEDGGCCHSLLRVLKVFSSSRSKTVLWNILDCGGLRVVSNKLKSKDSKLVLLAVETAVALTAPFDKRKPRCALSLPVSAANPVLESDSLSNLFDLLSHNTTEIQHHAWECIGNLMSSDIGRAALGNAGFVKFYLATAKNDDVRLSVRERCAQYLCLSCQESVNRAKIIELGGLRFIIDLLRETENTDQLVPSSLAVAAVAEFRYDAVAMEKFANLNLVKVLLSHLETKIVKRREQQTEDGEKTVSDVESETIQRRGSRKRKKKRGSDERKQMKRDSEVDDSDSQAKSDADEHTFFPPRIPQQYQEGEGEGLSPQYPVQWAPESPGMSPSSRISAASPSGYYSTGLSPPRIHCSGAASPTYHHQPTYQFPTSMMSPPKSDSASPGSSPSYFYDPSSPQKFFGYTEEIFSPVVSEESETDESSSSSSSSDTSDHVHEDRAGKRLRRVEKGDEHPSKRQKCSQETSGVLLEQATRKLSLSKEGELPHPLKSSGKLVPEMTVDSLVSGQEDMVSTDKETAIETMDEDGEFSRGSQSGNTGQNISATKKASSLSPSPVPFRRPSREPSSRRTSCSSDLTEGERTPVKGSERTHRHRKEEQNIVLILQEMVNLHHITPVQHITTESSMKTLLENATQGVVARERTHLLLKDVFSSRFFFDKVIAHNIPYVIYRAMNADQKQEERTERDDRHVINRRSSTTSENCGTSQSQTSKLLQYLNLIRDIAETTYGQKEVEHLLRGQDSEKKFGAAISLPYIYSSQAQLKHLLVSCKGLDELLHQLKDTASKVSRSLSRASRFLLLHWEAFSERHFALSELSSEKDNLMQAAGDNEVESSGSDECLYRAQEDRADLALVCRGGEVMRASRQVLSARSDYFTCLLTGHFQEAAQESIKLEGIRARSLQCVLHALYDCHPHHCRILRLLDQEPLDSLLDVLATLRFYMTMRDKRQADGVEFCPLEQKITHVILVSHLADRTVSKLTKFAALHGCQKFLKCCLLFILRERSHIRKHLAALLASQFGAQIKESIVELLQNS